MKFLDKIIYSTFASFLCCHDACFSLLRFVLYSRAFGDFEYKRDGNMMVESTPEVTERRVGPHSEFLVLACDGYGGSNSFFFHTHVSFVVFLVCI